MHFGNRSFLFMLNNFLRKTSPLRWGTLSAWGSRMIIMFSQIIIIRLLLSNLGKDYYAVLAIMQSLLNWVVIMDLGLSTSIQNFVAEHPKDKKRQDSYALLSFHYLLILIIVFIILSFLLKEHIASFLFSDNDKFRFLNPAESSFWVFLSLLLFSGQLLWLVLSKYWYGLHKSYIPNILVAISVLCSLMILFLFPNNNMSLNICFVFAPLGVLGYVSFIGVYLRLLKQIKRTPWNLTKPLLNRCKNFCLLSFFAAFVLKIDYIILARYCEDTAEIVAYSFSMKIMTSVFVMYSISLQVLSPSLTQSIKKGNRSLTNKKIKLYLTWGLFFILFASILLYTFNGLIVSLLSPKEFINLPFILIAMCGIYFIVRVWSDTFAVAINSTSELKGYRYLLPVQAIMTVAFMIYFVQQYAAAGVYLSQIIVLMLTSVWYLPILLNKISHQYMNDYKKG